MSALERDLEILFYFLIFTEFVLLYCFCFMFWFFGPKACGIFVPQPEIGPASPELEGEVLTTGPPGKSLKDPVIQPVTLYSNNKHHC